MMVSVSGFIPYCFCCDMISADLGCCLVVNSKIEKNRKK